MGQTISKVRATYITRNVQRFNIESRTEKVLNKEKPIAAPKYKTDEELLQSIRHDYPELADASTKKDTQLLQKLEKVYVTSTDPVSIL